jgi:hypothetical protein
MSTWSEVVVHGHTAAVRAFAAGVAGGRGETASPLVFGDDVGIAHASLGEKLRELLTAGTHVVVLGPTDAADDFVDALERDGAAAGLKLERKRPLTGARFGFTLQAFNREQASAAKRALLESLPAGVKVDGLAQAEESHAEAKGVELYAPLHAYTYRASGLIAGPVPGVLEVRRRAAAVDGIDLGKLALV